MNDFSYEIFTAFDKATRAQVSEIVEFLYKSYQKTEVEKPAIREAIACALKEHPSFGGVVITLKKKELLVGASVVNFSGMELFFPPNILAYFAIHSDYRKQSLGTRLLTHALQYCSGDVLLPIDTQNPNRGFFEGFGFEDQYMTMRLTRKGTAVHAKRRYDKT